MRLLKVNFKKYCIKYIFCHQNQYISGEYKILDSAAGTVKCEPNYPQNYGNPILQCNFKYHEISLFFTENEANTFPDNIMKIVGTPHLGFSHRHKLSQEEKCLKIVTKTPLSLLLSGGYHWCL